MTIDGSKVMPNTARAFRAIGGGYGIKMFLQPSSRGEFLFGAKATREAAELVKDRINAMHKGSHESHRLMDTAKAPVPC